MLQYVQGRRIVRGVPQLLVAVAVLAAAATTHADCTGDDGVVLNEIRYVDHPSPVFGYMPASVELYNDASSPVALSGWTIRDHDAAIVATLPPLVIPGRAYLDVVFAAGVDDLDFTDSVATIYTNGDSVGVFTPDEGGVALYDAGFAIVDYVTWSLSGTPVVGAAYLDAVNANIWPSGAAAPHTEADMLFTIRLQPDGYDHDRPEDWVRCGWGDSGYGSRVAGPNQIQIAPNDGSGIESASVDLVWQEIAAATAYRLVVTDSVGGVELDALVASPDTTLALGPGVHTWSVGVVDSCGETPSSSWSFVMLAGLASKIEPAAEALKVTRETQHKDSQLLCIWNEVGRTRPGCSEAPGVIGPWDDAHPDDHAEQIDAKKRRHICPHCAMYCSRAVVQMINHFYGGDLSQDRISVLFKEHGDTRFISPEGDLGHGMGAGFGGQNRPASVQPVLQAVLANENVSTPRRVACVPRLPPCAPGDLPFLSYAGVKAEIDAGNPIFVASPQHAMLVTGYRDARPMQPNNMVHVVDPWSGKGNWNGWQDAGRYGAVAGVYFWWQISKAGAPDITGTAQEATVTTDSDNDGVQDFDEGVTGGGGANFPPDRPRNFHSRPNAADSDGDTINDKEEIRAYTFHVIDHKNHNPGSNPDNDRLRAEADIDSDNDRDADGNEDLNQNGKFEPAGMPKETDMLSAASKRAVVRARKANNKTARFADGSVSAPISVLDDSLVSPGEHVILSGEDFQPGALYTWFAYPTCPPPMVAPAVYASPLATGSAIVDPDGNLVPVDLGTYGLGCYSVVVDVFADGFYGNVYPDPESFSSAPADTEFVEVESGFEVIGSVPVEDIGLLASSVDATVRLSWQVAATSETGVAQIERGPTSTGPWTLLARMALGAPGEAGDYVDASLDRPGEYWYRLVVASADGAHAFAPVVARVAEPPLRVAVLRNPVRAGGAALALSLPRSAPTQLRIYDASGRLVRRLLEAPLRMGTSRQAWDGRDEVGSPLPSGIYFVRLSVAGREHVAKLTLLR